MQGCEYSQRRCRGAVTAMTMTWLLAASFACAQPTSVPTNSPQVMGDHDTRALEQVAPGEVVYSTDDGYIAPAADCYSPYGMNYSPSMGAHLRARYNTRSYGQVRGNLDLGTMKVFDAPRGIWFVDGQVTLNDESKVGYNAGIGYRFMTLPLLPNSADDAKIAGISLWSDGSTTINENFISQVGVSLEYLGDNWDVRWNAYLPTSDIEIGEFTPTGNISFVGDFLSQETMAGTDEALDVTEFEIARRLGNRDAWVFGGGYGLYGETVDTNGLKVGVRGYLTPDLAVQFAVNDDDEFGTNSVFSITWFIGRTRDPSYCSPALHQRMRDPVIRNDYVAVRQDTVTDGVAIEGDIDGDGVDELIRVVHVDSSAAAGGDGSFENPLDELVDINGASTSPSIVLVHGGSTFNNDTAVLLDGQRMLGEGNGIEHIVSTTDFGDIVLPETAIGASTGIAPVINNAAGDVISLATNTLEVSNLTIDGGDRAVVSPSGSLGVNLNNLAISNTNGNGIELTPGSETIDGDLSVRFQPMITDITFDNIGGDDINIDATSPEAASVPVTEGIAISNVTSTQGQGVGINLSNNVSTVTIDNYTNDLGTGAAGILLTANEAAVNITDATITNQTGMGVSVVDSEANHTFNGLEITDTSGAAMHVSGGTGDVSFTGKIIQGDTGAALLVENGHTGALDFFEETADEGVIEALSGDGLVFNDADGTYTFLDGVSIEGTTQGIDVTNDSAGTLTFLDATITDPNGTAINFDGGSASMSYTGKVTQSNAFDTLRVTGEHTGTLTFDEGTADDGVIEATNGDGLVFNNADGGYIFNHGVSLDGSGNGADTGIDILNDSDGTFTFADGTIVDPTGEAVRVDGGSSIFTFTGEISQNNNVAAVSVTGGHDGAMTFLSADGTTNVLTATNGAGLQFDDADGDYGFVGPVSLDGSAVAADTGIDIINGSDGTFTFGDTTITDPTGVAVNVVGGEADVDFTGKINQSNNAAAVSVTGGHTGTMNFNEATAGDGVVDATNGTGIQFDDADGTYLFNDAVVLNGGDAGIDILNDSAGTFTFADTTITDPTGIGFNVVGGEADVNFTGKINQSNNFAAVSVTGGHNGTMNFDEATAGDGVVDATNGTGLQFDNADGTYRFNDAVVLNGGDAGVDIVNGSSGTFSFASDSEITNATGDEFVITNSNANVDYNGTITNNSGNAVRIENNTGGTVTFDGQVTDTDQGILVQNNTGGSFSFGGGVDLDTGANDAVTLLNNSGTTLSFSDMDINTTTGDGFVATNSEGVQVLGLGNTITTTTGVGLNMNDVVVSNAGMTIDSVSVDGATSGIIMNDVTGGLVLIGVGATTAGDGGSIQNTTGDGVQLTNVENVSLNFLEIDTTGGAGVSINHNAGFAEQSTVIVSGSEITGTTSEGIVLNGGNANDLSVTVSDNTVNNTGGENVALNINGVANNADLIVTGNTLDNNSDEEALLITGNDATVKTINLLVSENSMNNDSAGASAMELQANDDATINATFLNNNMSNATNDAFTASTNAAGSDINLRMEDNAATSGDGGDDYFLIENAGTFRVQNLTTPNDDGETIDTANTGTFDIDAGITEFGGTVPQP